METADLLRIRGHLADPELPEKDLPAGRTIYGFVDAFPLSDELAVLVFHTGAMLVNVHTQEVFWSIICRLTHSALDPVHNMLALANGIKMYLWNLTTGHLERRWNTESAVTDMVFPPHGNLLATALWEKPDVALWQVTDGQMVQSLEHNASAFGVPVMDALSTKWKPIPMLSASMGWPSASMARSSSAGNCWE